MKKRLSFLALAFLAVLTASAQMIAYTVETSAGTLVPLTGATEVQALDPDTDEPAQGDAFKKLAIDADGVSWVTATDAAPGFPIGFDFAYNGQQMKYFLLTTNGVVLLSHTQAFNTNVHLATNANEFGYGSAHDLFGLVIRGGTYGFADTKLSYKVDGAEGSRVLTIEYLNLGLRSWWNNEAEDSPLGKVTIQYRLYEADGTVEFVLSNFKPLDNAPFRFQTEWIRTGIVGDNGDALMLSDWVGGTATSTSTNIVYTADSYPADGTTVRFLAPEPCETPAVAPTDLVLTSTSTRVSGTFTVGSADRYLVLMSDEGTPSEAPADKVKYAVNDVIGNAKVIAIVETGEFSTANNLTPSATYGFAVYGQNYKCAAGPLYNATPAAAAIVTKPGAPEAITAAATGKNSVKLSVTAAEGANAIVLMSNEENLNFSTAYPDCTGAFAELDGEVNAGDEIVYTYQAGGQTYTVVNKVVYVGPSTDDIEVTGIKAGTPCFFRAYGVNGDGISTVYVDAADVTTSELPWAFELKQWAPFDPVGWTKGEDGTWSVSARNPLTASFSNSISFTSTELLKEAWMQSPAIELSEGTNTLKLKLSATMFTSRTFSAPTYEMQEGEKIAIQLTTDGVNYTDILTIDKDNSPAHEADEENELEAGNYFIRNETISYKVDFTEFAGQTVQLRVYVKRFTNGAVQISGLSLNEQGGYEFVANEWPAGDAGRISPSNVVVDEELNTITVSQTGQNNVALIFRSANAYKVKASQRYFVIKATGLSKAEGASCLWWLNNTNNGSHQPTDIYEENGQTVFTWDINRLPIGGRLGLSDTDLTDGGGWSTTFGMTLEDESVPAVISYIGFSNYTKNPAEEQEYEFVAAEWPAGDPGRISPSNVVVDEEANTITISQTGQNNVALNFKTDKLYYLAKPVKYFVIRATGLSQAEGDSYLWWLNAKNNGGQVVPTFVLTDDEGVTTMLWDIAADARFAEGFNDTGITYLDGTGAYTWGWTTTFGLTLADNSVPAVISYIGYEPADTELVTAISTAKTDVKASDAVYNMNGQRVTNMGKGLYIVSGKKLLVK